MFGDRRVNVFAKRSFITSGALILFFWSCQREVRTADDVPGRSPELGATGGDVAAEAPFLEESPVGGNAIGATTIEANFLKTPASSYVFPVMAGKMGSSWCVCRSIGTSPHVGQDLVDGGVGTQKSVALSNGKIQKVSFDPACGWSVMFQDSMGSDWRYVHLNEPYVKVGQVVARGSVLGINRDYPKEGCGTGAHLHLERRSSGRWGSAEEFATCQYGRQSCYYNPVTPLRNARVIATESERVGVVKDSPLR